MPAPALLQAASPRGPGQGRGARPCCCPNQPAAPPQQRQPGRPFSQGTGEGEENARREKSRQVCAEGGMRREGSALRTACGGTPGASPPLLRKQPLPADTCRAAGKGGSEGREQLSVTGREGGREGGDESRGFAQSIADTPACPLPRTSGEQAMGRREGGREGWGGVHRRRCRGWLTSRCLCWGCLGAREVNPGLCSPRRVLGKGPSSVTSRSGL